MYFLQHGKYLEDDFSILFRGETPKWNISKVWKHLFKMIPLQGKINFSFWKFFYLKIYKLKRQHEIIWIFSHTLLKQSQICLYLYHFRTEMFLTSHAQFFIKLKSQILAHSEASVELYMVSNEWNLAFGTQSPRILGRHSVILEVTSLSYFFLC